MTLHAPHFRPYTPHSAFYTLHFTLRTFHLTRHRRCPLHETPHSKFYTPHSTLCSLDSALYTLHFMLHTLHFTLDNLDTSHSTLYSPHSTLYASHFTLHTLHFTLQTSPFTLDTSHSTIPTSHPTHYIPTQHSAVFTLHCIPHSILYTGTVAEEKCTKLLKLFASHKCFTWLHSGSLVALVFFGCVEHPHKRQVVSSRILPILRVDKIQKWHRTFVSSGFFRLVWYLRLIILMTHTCMHLCALRADLSGS